MQLIQLNEPTAIDIKKTMSTLGDTLETNQMNGTITEIENDCATNKISLNKNDVVSKSVGDVKEKNKDLNGITKTNRYAQNEDNTFERTSYEIETEFFKDNIENGSSANGKNNESLTLSKPFESPTSIPVGIFSSVDKNTKFEENIVNDNNKNIDDKKNCKDNVDNGFSSNGQINESLTLSKTCKSPTSILVDIVSPVDNNTKSEENVTDSNKDNTEDNEIKSDVKTAVVSSNYTVATENSSANVKTNADTGDERVIEPDKVKNIAISVEHEHMASESAFSPNSDTEEKDINISAQLQQLEDDASMEEYVNPPTSIKNEIVALQKGVEINELKNDQPASPMKEQEPQPMTTKQKENNDGDILKEQGQKQIRDGHSQNEVTQIKAGSEVSTNENLIDLNNVPERDLEIPPIEEKLEKSPNTSLDHSIETKTAMDIVDQQLVNDGTDIQNQNSEDAIEKQLLDKNQEDSGCDIIMEVDDVKPGITEVPTEEKLDSSNPADTDVDKIPLVKKHIKVKNFIDTAMAKNSEVSVVSDDKQPSVEDQTQRNEAMDVDYTDVVTLVTPENNVSFNNASDKVPLIQKDTEVENLMEMADTKIIDTEENKNISPENCKEKELSKIELKDSDDVVMEVDDVKKKPIVEKSVPDTAVNIVEVQNATDVNIFEETVKQSVKITDKKDEQINNSTPVNRELNNDDASQLKTVVRQLNNDEASELSEVISIDDSVKDAATVDSKKPSNEVEIMDGEDITYVKEKYTQKQKKHQGKIREKKAEKMLPVICKLSNTLNILSDDEDDPPVVKSSEDTNKVIEEAKKVDEENKCINLDDDDDIMFIEDTNSQSPKDVEKKSEEKSNTVESESISTGENKTNPDTGEKEINTTNIDEVTPKSCQQDISPIEIDSHPKVEETKPDEPSVIKETKAPLISKTFLKSVTKNLADMTRNELEDFCILKLVESVVDKSNLNEIKSKMKTMAQTVEDLRKKTLALTKQNRDLQVVVKTVQEDQKKRSANPMMPMKITRSVGMQVVLSGGEKSILKKKLSMPPQPPPITPGRPVRNMQSPKTQKTSGNNIPVPRLVPASSPTIKSPATPVNSVAKPPVSNVRNTTPLRPEKRPHSKLSSPSAVTVDLTDDEPPAKVNTKNPTPPVRLVPSQNLMPVKTRPQFGPAGNSPRKVYIPISSNSQNMRPGAAVIRNFVPPTSRPRQPSVVRMQTARLSQIPSTNRHPAPLPDAMKQYQPPTWKALPPAPDLKLSKVDNGIVISWKFEGYQPDTYEEVASFQLYAYQETPAPPSTALWKKIGDIKALPLPMACTLTQFMSGFKYYFAVRAIDVRSRIGPFSLPGSIMLISKS